MDNDLTSVIARVKSKNDARQKDPDFAAELKKKTSPPTPASKKIKKDFPTTYTVTNYSFVPTEMTRVSPFFVLSDSSKEEYTKLTCENPWGKMTISGLKLSIHDEDVLMAIVKLFLKQNSETVTTTRSEICTIMGVASGKATYESITRSLDKLITTLITLEIKDNKTGKHKLRMGSTILSGSKEWDSGKIIVTINPYFKESFLDTMVTSIDIDFRMSLSHDISKSLYRFLEGQGKHYRISIDKLIITLNLNKDQERYHIRQLIKHGLKELQEKGYLESWSMEDDIVSTVKRLASLDKDRKLLK